MIRDWLSEGEDELRSSDPPISKEKVLEDTQKYESRLQSLSDKIYEVLFAKSISEVRVNL